jgi:uncharacterized membrane protein YhaH (DUF805 family)
MEKIKKYFQFTGTISGTNYFLRNLLLGVLAFGVGYGIGMSIAMNNIGVLMSFVALFAPIMWLQVTTIYKRMSALFPEDKTMFTAGLVTLQLIMNAMSPDNPFRAILTLVLLVFVGILIFKNSNIENHEG